MTARIVPVPPFDLVVFGATGDLAARKLFPALFHRDLVGQLSDDSRIIGASRTPMDDDAFRALVRAAIAPGAGDDHAAVARFLARLHHVTLDATSAEGWPQLAALIKGSERQVVFYLATAPELFVPIAEKLRAHGLTEHARVVLEKPIGKSLASALALNEAIGKVFSEQQVFRIDHYLGKETVQNLMALRFANALFEPLWNAAHIDHVQITVAETVGAAGRGGYYDTAGAMRDMVQNHLLQLLCLVAMEPPPTLDADAVRDAKLKVLQSLVPLTGQAALAATVRGQYRAGAVEGQAVAGYADDIAKPDSRNETFVALRAEIANWRWAGVPFYLRTGKRMPSRMSEIVLTFRPIPHSVFEPSAGRIIANQLVLRLQPDEGVKLFLMLKDPGPGGMRLEHVPLDMSFAATFAVRNPDAYERLLMDVVRGNQTLFMRRDEVEAAWRWVDPILEAWAASSEPPKPYGAGTSGPAAAVALIERDGRTWSDSVEAVA